MKKVVVNLVNHNAPYLNAQKRLIGSFWNFHIPEEEIKIMPLIGEESVGSPYHQNNPYAFKLYAIEYSRNMGYEKVLWLDASVIFVKHSKPLFDWIESKGFFFEEAGHLVGTWCNDRTLQYFGISRDEANQMPMFSAGFTGLDFANPIAVEFFDKWKQSMLDGQFLGEWSNHRHDMTCASIIANKMGLLKDYSSGGNYFAYVGSGYGEQKESVICNLLGI
jgi:hypothetical protein